MEQILSEISVIQSFQYHDIIENSIVPNSVTKSIETVVASLKKGGCLVIKSDRYKSRNFIKKASSHKTNSSRKPEVECNDAWTMVDTAKYVTDRHSNTSNIIVKEHNKECKRIQETVCCSNTFTALDDSDTDNDKKIPIVTVQKASSHIPSPILQSPMPRNNRYVSIFKSASDENIDDTIMNTIIRGKLNKFNTSNYSDIFEFMCQILDSGQTDFLNQFLMFVFQKATSEEFFCPLYAKLLSDLSSKYVVIKDGMLRLFQEYLNVFKDIDEAVNDKDYSDFIKHTGEKKYRVGYSQFLTELIKQRAIGNDIFFNNIHLIVSQIKANVVKDGQSQSVEEFADCLLRISRSLTLDITTDRCSVCIKSEFKDAITQNMHGYLPRNVINKSLTNRARFTIMELCDEVKKFKI